MPGPFLRKREEGDVLVRSAARRRRSARVLRSPGSHRRGTIDESARFANAIIVLKDDRPDPFFDEAARAMLRAVILML